MGYKNTTVTRRFPELSEESVTGDIADDDLIWVKIRNPKLMPLEALIPDEAPVDPETGESSNEAAMTATFAMLAGLIVDWHVFDANDLGDNPPPYPKPTADAPASAAQVRGLPFAIINDLTDLIKEVTTTPR